MRSRPMAALAWLASAMAAVTISGVAAAQNLAPPTDLVATDHPNDTGEKVDLSWTLSADDALLAGYNIYRSLTPLEMEAEDAQARSKAIGAAKAKATEETKAALEAEGVSPESSEWYRRIREARAAAAESAGAAFDAEAKTKEGETRWLFLDTVLPGTSTYTADKIEPEKEIYEEEEDGTITKTVHELSYLFRVEAFTQGGERVSEPAITASPISPTQQFFDGGRAWFAGIAVVICGSVIFFIALARSGRPLKVRKIAGLEAVDEAVGRATEMGRSCLFVPGIQDMNDIQTIAGITVLSRVAKTAAEYDAKVEVPTSKSLVMTTARETVESAFLSAGRPDAFNPNMIYYVTDEQFGYVAYLSGMMVREKPAACFYMGSFFAESLILAETGNSIGAIQVAGTAQPAQLPFFVAACDYTLIGEEFFAASAYLSGSPEELGSLKGQDVGKVLVALFMIVGVALATWASVGAPGAAKAQSVVEYMISEILS